jgi:hypothetical protein
MAVPPPKDFTPLGYEFSYIFIVNFPLNLLKRFKQNQIDQREIPALCAEDRFPPQGNT